MGTLTVKKVEALTRAGIKKMHGDGSGLYLQVSGPGSASWILRTKVRGKERKIGLGSVSLVSLADAREEAKRLRAVARAGGDPIAQRDGERSIPTFAEVARETHDSLSAGWVEGHGRRWLGSLQRYAFPVIGARPIDTLTTRDVMAVLAPIWHEKADTAKRVKQRIEAVFRRAISEGYIEGDNPASNADVSVLGHQVAPVRHMPAMPYADVPQFFTALLEREAVAARALAFQIATALRPGEAGATRWEWIDWEARTLTLPGAYMKGRKGKTPDHVVPLSSAALAVLQATAGGDEGWPSAGLAFPYIRSGKQLSDGARARLLERMGHDGITAHGFRSSFKNWAMEQHPAVPDAVSEMCLAHVVGSEVRRAYARSDLLAQRRRLMDLWGTHLTGEALGTVVQLRA